jgi:hypothetical protein
VIAYDVKSSILLIAAIATEATGPLATILVNTSTPLLGQTPALKPLPQDDGYSRPPSMSRNRERQPLSLERGEFVTVVGWLESDQSKLSRQVSCPRDTLERSSLITDRYGDGLFTSFSYRAGCYIYRKLEAASGWRCVSRYDQDLKRIRTPRQLDGCVVRTHYRKGAALEYGGLKPIRHILTQV